MGRGGGRGEILVILDYEIDSLGFGGGRAILVILKYEIGVEGYTLKKSDFKVHPPTPIGSLHYLRASYANVNVNELTYMRTAKV